MDEPILYLVADRIAWITLNRPEKRNALSFALRRQLVDRLRDAERDDSVTLVLIDGAGPALSAGYDLADERSSMPYGWVESEHYASWTDQYARSILRDWLVIWDLLKPVVARVHGYCLAGGTELMSMCDIAIVADDAVIGYPPMRGMTTPDTLYFP
jgi:enoyl-CoA hydratase